MRFTGKVRIDTAGAHTFTLVSDDGSRLLIDGRAVVDHDGNHGPTERSGVMQLEPGLHDLVVEYFEDSGGQMVTLDHAPPGKARAVLGIDRLLPQ